MKKIVLIILAILLLIGYFTYKELYLKYFIVFEGKTVNSDISREETNLLISEKSKLIGNINLKKGEIVFEDNSYFSGSIILERGNIIIGKNVKIYGDIKIVGDLILGENSIIKGNLDISGKIILEKNSKINGNINTDSNLFKDSSSAISGIKPNLYVTTDYPDFLKHFDSLPNSHKKEFGYIFLTSHNMDIRGKELKPQDYFKNIFYFENGELKNFDFKNTEKLQNLYNNAEKYINLIAERKVSRFGVGFTTKSYSFDKKRADIYISSEYANDVLFIHEFGHVLDYAYGFIDNYNPKYPYFKKENSITDYGKFHVGEDFAEAYRFYILHYNSFHNKMKDNMEITKKYNYLKNYVFNKKEYN